MQEDCHKFESPVLYTVSSRTTGATKQHLISNAKSKEFFLKNSLHDFISIAMNERNQNRRITWSFFFRHKIIGQKCLGCLCALEQCIQHSENSGCNYYQ